MKSKVGLQIMKRLSVEISPSSCYHTLNVFTESERLYKAVEIVVLHNSVSMFVGKTREDNSELNKSAYSNLISF